MIVFISGGAERRWGAGGVQVFLREFKCKISVFHHRLTHILSDLAAHSVMSRPECLRSGGFSLFISVNFIYNSSLNGLFLNTVTSSQGRRLNTFPWDWMEVFLLSCSAPACRVTTAPWQSWAEDQHTATEAEQNRTEQKALLMEVTVPAAATWGRPLGSPGVNLHMFSGHGWEYQR